MKTFLSMVGAWGAGFLMHLGLAAAEADLIDEVRNLLGEGQAEAAVVLLDEALQEANPSPEVLYFGLWHAINFGDAERVMTIYPRAWQGMDVGIRRPFLEAAVVGFLAREGLLEKYLKEWRDPSENTGTDHPFLHLYLAALVRHGPSEDARAALEKWRATLADTPEFWSKERFLARRTRDVEWKVNLCTAALESAWPDDHERGVAVARLLRLDDFSPPELLELVLPRIDHLSEPEALRLARNLVGGGNSASAVRLLEYWEEVHGPAVKTMVIQARALAELGRSKEALALFQSAWDAAPPADRLDMVPDLWPLFETPAAFEAWLEREPEDWLRTCALSMAAFGRGARHLSLQKLEEAWEMAPRIEVAEWGVNRDHPVPTRLVFRERLFEIRRDAAALSDWIELLFILKRKDEARRVFSDHYRVYQADPLPLIHLLGRLFREPGMEALIHHWATPRRIADWPAAIMRAYYFLLSGELALAEEEFQRVALMPHEPGPTPWERQRWRRQGLDMLQMPGVAMPSHHVSSLQSSGFRGQGAANRFRENWLEKEEEDRHPTPNTNWRPNSLSGAKWQALGWLHELADWFPNTDSLEAFLARHFAPGDPRFLISARMHEDWPLLLKRLEEFSASGRRFPGYETFAMASLREAVDAGYEAARFSPETMATLFPRLDADHRFENPHAQARFIEWLAVSGEVDRARDLFTQSADTLRPNWSELGTWMKLGLEIEAWEGVGRLYETMARQWEAGRNRSFFNNTVTHLLANSQAVWKLQQWEDQQTVETDNLAMNLWMLAFEIRAHDAGNRRHHYSDAMSTSYEKLLPSPPTWEDFFRQQRDRRLYYQMRSFWSGIEEASKEGARRFRNFFLAKHEVWREDPNLQLAAAQLLMQMRQENEMNSVLDLWIQSHSVAEPWLIYLRSAEKSRVAAFNRLADREDLLSRTMTYHLAHHLKFTTEAIELAGQIAQADLPEYPRWNLALYLWDRQSFESALELFGPLARNATSSANISALLNRARAAEDFGKAEHADALFAIILEGWPVSIVEPNERILNAKKQASDHFNKLNDP